MTEPRSSSSSPPPSEPAAAPDEREQWRQAMRARFERWLDEASQAAELPAGIAAEVAREVEEDRTGAAGSCDLYSLWSAMTALTQEVKLQGRTFKQLALLVQEQAATAADDEADEADGPDPDKLLEALLAARDRLKRGLQAAREHLDQARRDSEASLLRRLIPTRSRDLPAAVRELERGYELSCEWLDDTLRGLGVTEIECLGRPFDPRRMNAVEVELTAQAAEGTVLEVIRPGYELSAGGHRRLLRHCEVKVARRS